MWCDTQGSGLCCIACPDSETYVLFAYSTWLLPRVLASQRTDYDQAWRSMLHWARNPRCHASRATGGLSGGLAWDVGAWPNSVSTFCDNRTGDHFRSEKNDAKLGQTAASQARPQDTDHLARPSNLAARTLSLVEPARSKFCRDPCPVRRRFVAAAKCSVRKSRFFLFKQRREITHHYRRQCSRVSARWKQILFCLLCLSLWPHILYACLGWNFRTDTGCTADVDGKKVSMWRHPQQLCRSV